MKSDQDAEINRLKTIANDLEKVLQYTDIGVEWKRDQGFVISISHVPERKLLAWVGRILEGECLFRQL